MPNVVTLDMNTPSVQYLCKKDKRLARVIKMVGPIQYTSHDENAYSFLTHEIIEQMLSVKAGQKIYNRLEKLCGEEISPLHSAVFFPVIAHLTPTEFCNFCPIFILGLCDGLVFLLPLSTTVFLVPHPLSHLAVLVPSLVVVALLSDTYFVNL